VSYSVPLCPSFGIFWAIRMRIFVFFRKLTVNARRTHYLNIAQEIARKLRLNYVFGREFVELTPRLQK